jgi:hypothetical protein
VSVLSMRRPTTSNPAKRSRCPACYPNRSIHRANRGARQVRSRHLARVVGRGFPSLLPTQPESSRREGWQVAGDAGACAGLGFRCGRGARASSCDRATAQGVSLPLGLRPWLHGSAANSSAVDCSAAECSALFVGFTATMAESDFSCPCIIGYGSSPSRCGPSLSLDTDGQSRDIPSSDAILLRVMWPSTPAGRQCLA